MKKVILAIGYGGKKKIFTKNTLLCFGLGLFVTIPTPIRALVGEENFLVKENYQPKFTLRDSGKYEKVDEILTMQFNRLSSETATMLHLYKAEEKDDYQIFLAVSKNKGIGLNLQYYIEMKMVDGKLHIPRKYTEEIKGLFGKKNLPDVDMHIISAGEIFDGFKKLTETLESKKERNANELVNLLAFLDPIEMDGEHEVLYDIENSDGIGAAKILMKKSKNIISLRYTSIKTQEIFNDLTKVLNQKGGNLE